MYVVVGLNNVLRNCTCVRARGQNENRNYEDYQEISDSFYGHAFEHIHTHTSTYSHGLAESHTYTS